MQTYAVSCEDIQIFAKNVENKLICHLPLSFTTLSSFWTSFTQNDANMQTYFVLCEDIPICEKCPKYANIHIYDGIYAYCITLYLYSGKIKKLTFLIFFYYSVVTALLETHFCCILGG